MAWVDNLSTSDKNGVIDLAMREMRAVEKENQIHKKRTEEKQIARKGRSWRR